MKNKKIAIFGLGLEGISAFNFLAPNNNVSIYDEQKPDITLLEQSRLPINTIQNPRDWKGEKYDYIVRSPGIRPDHNFIKDLVSEGAELTSATNIFFELCPAPIIGVTGTKGKGTTSTLIYKFLKTQFTDTILAGNIGTPMLDLLPNITKNTKVVLELSSFQLIDLKKSPHISVVLMITSEHLDWHIDKNEYLKAKQKIVTGQNKNDIAVINNDYPNSQLFQAATVAKVYFYSTKTQVNGVYIDGDKIKSNVNKNEIIASTTGVALPGKHNLENVCAAAAVAKIYNISNQNIQEVLKTFKGLPHRLEMVADVDGVKFYNDSFSTTPETTIAAINAFNDPKILILGGSSKNSDFRELVNTIEDCKSLKAIIFVGPEGQRIKDMLNSTKNNFKQIDGLSSMQEIVKTAKNISQKNDIVLLSPACASFDMFKNYKDRGEQFKKYVKQM